MTKRHENCVSNKVITIGYSQYVSLVSRSMVSCFNLLFFFPMFLRYPLSFSLSLSRTVNPFLRLATCSPFLIILQAWNGVSHRSPRISREFPRSVNRRELIDHRPNSFFENVSNGKMKNCLSPRFISLDATEERFNLD